MCKFCHFEFDLIIEWCEIDFILSESLSLNKFMSHIDFEPFHLLIHPRNDLIKFIL